MRIREANLEAIRAVAKALGEINGRIAYVGGAVVALYADDPAADNARPTIDIDMVVRITGERVEPSRGRARRKRLYAGPFRECHMQVQALGYSRRCDEHERSRMCVFKQLV